MLLTTGYPDHGSSACLLNHRSMFSATACYHQNHWPPATTGATATSHHRHDEQRGHVVEEGGRDDIGSRAPATATWRETCSRRSRLR